MKKYWLIGSCLFALIACKNEGEVDGESTEQPKEQVDSTNQTAATKLNIGTIELKDDFQIKSLNLTIERKASLPKIEGDDKINNWIQNLSVDFFQEIMGQDKSKASDNPQARLTAAWNVQKKEVSTDVKGMEAYHDNRVWDETMQSSVYEFSPNYLILVNSYQNYWGGAHGMYGEYYSILDRKTQQNLKVEDIFSDQKGASKLFEKHFRVWLKKNDVNWDELLLEDNKYPLPTNLFLKTDSLFVLHNVYEVGPYAMGAIQYGIPLKEIRPFFKKDFQP